MKLQGFAIALAVLFCNTVVTTNGFYIRANNQTTTPISVEASHNATLATTLTSPVVNTTKLPTTNSTLLEATTTKQPTINATKATALNMSRSVNTAIKEQVTFGSTKAAPTTTASTTVAITSSSDKKVTELPWVRRQEDSRGYSEDHDKSFLSTVYGKVALVSGIAFLSVMLAAVVFLSVTWYHERKSEQRVLMGEIESIDDQDDDTDNTTYGNKSGYTELSHGADN